MTAETMPISVSRRAVELFPAVNPASDRSSLIGQDEKLRQKEAASRSLFVVSIIGITVFGLILRIHFLNQPMRYDESYNYLHFASHSIPFILSNYVPNNHVLHTLMLHVAVGIFGDSPECLRLPAFAAGALLITATGWLAWILSQRFFASMFAATAACVSSACIEYSTNARGYSWLMLFAAIQFILTVNAASTTRQRTSWIAWAIVGALGAFTVPVMILWSVSLCAASVSANYFAKRKTADERSVVRNSIIALACCAALTSLLYAPAILTSGLSGLQATHRMSTGILDQQLPGFGDAMISAGRLFLRNAGSFCPIVVVLGFIVATFRAVTSRKHELLVAIAAAILSVTAITLFRMPLPARAWLFLWPVVVGVSSAGVAFVVEAMILRLATSNSMENAPNPFISFITRCSVIFVFAIPLLDVLREPYLVSEPGGLVDVEPAIDACRDFGLPHCTVVSRYTPATAYYLREKKMPDFPLPKDPSVQRIFLVAENPHDLKRLWNDRLAGDADFAEPYLLPVKSSRSIYVADRREASCDKYPATPPAVTH